ncbi:hypothetical protein BGZ57DRAFT_971376 [Hyaloscypha finlandica]|nr:hypothetical protein BGZ57DRAFT_971376 [Hyaloscypha finlandica]
MPPSETIPLNLPPATAFNTFSVEKQSHPGRQRAKFGLQRRREVEALVVHAHQRYALTFSAYIRTSTPDASIFDLREIPPLLRYAQAKIETSYSQRANNCALINLVMDETKVHIEDRDGTLREYVSKESIIGKSVGRWFCFRCGNPVKSVPVTRPRLVIVKLSNFPRFPAPEFETFALHRHLRTPLV